MQLLVSKIRRACAPAMWTDVYRFVRTQHCVSALQRRDKNPSENTSQPHFTVTHTQPSPDTEISTRAGYHMIFIFNSKLESVGSLQQGFNLFFSSRSMCTGPAAVTIIEP